MADIKHGGGQRRGPGRDIQAHAADWAHILAQVPPSAWVIQDVTGWAWWKRRTRSADSSRAARCSAGKAASAACSSCCGYAELRGLASIQAFGPFRQGRVAAQAHVAQDALDDLSRGERLAKGAQDPFLDDGRHFHIIHRDAFEDGLAGSGGVVKF